MDHSGVTAREPDAGPPGRRACPICGKPADAEAFPFCSRRCADIDLNRWLKGAYAIPATEPPGGSEPQDD